MRAQLHNALSTTKTTKREQQKQKSTTTIKTNVFEENRGEMETFEKSQK